MWVNGEIELEVEVEFGMDGQIDTEEEEAVKRTSRMKRRARSRRWRDRRTSRRVWARRHGSGRPGTQ